MTTVGSAGHGDLCWTVVAKSTDDLLGIEPFNRGERRSVHAALGALIHTRPDMK